MKTKICECCSQSFPCATRAKKYCSIRCYRQHQWQLTKDSITNASSIIATKNGFVKPSVAKKYLLEMHGDCCQICKCSTWQSKPLVKILDHIDGNATNWGLNNLRLICSNCDSQLPTYKSRNNGKGRFSRRKRYKLNQSY